MKNKKANFLLSIVMLISFLSIGWGFSLHRLHREKGPSNKNIGIVSDYVEWKITPKGFKYMGVDTFEVVWRVHLRNTRNKRIKLAVFFQLLDKDNFIIPHLSRAARKDLSTFPKGTPFLLQKIKGLSGCFLVRIKAFLTTLLMGISLFSPFFAFSIYITLFLRSISRHLRLRISPLRIPVFKAINAIVLK